MAGRLRKFRVHGAYSSKRSAVRKERKVKGFVLKRKIRGRARYLVLTRRK